MSLEHKHVVAACRDHTGRWSSPWKAQPFAAKFSDGMILPKM
jgi:hypothetical protein